MLGEKFHGCDILYGIEEAVIWYWLYRTTDFTCCSEKKNSKKIVGLKGVK